MVEPDQDTHSNHPGMQFSSDQDRDQPGSCQDQRKDKSSPKTTTIFHGGEQ
jgi:hypothetical protein